MHTVDVDDIDTIQFVDMNVILGTAGINNRYWVKNNTVIYSVGGLISTPVVTRRS